MKKLLVIGSINMDIVIETNNFPEVGETLLGNNINFFCGGKGANQAIAAARMGEDVHFMGCIGDDEFGIKLIHNFRDNHINTKLIDTIKGASTGVAAITVSEGDNSIIVVSGANSCLDKEYIRSKESKIKSFDYVLIQNEIPLSGVEEIINICNENNIQVIYNPAPYDNKSKKLIEKVTFVTPNEIEQNCIGKYSDNMITTLGEKGVLYKDEIIKANKVKVVDTTGAGDTFNGVFTAFLMKDKSPKEAIEYAQRASSLSIKKKGAQTGMPELEDIL